MDVPVYVTVEDAPYDSVSGWHDHHDGKDKVATLRVGKYNVLEVRFHGHSDSDLSDEAAYEIANALSTILKPEEE